MSVKNLDIALSEIMDDSTVAINRDEVTGFNRVAGELIGKADSHTSKGVHEYFAVTDPDNIRGLAAPGFAKKGGIWSNCQ